MRRGPAVLPLALAAVALTGAAAAQSPSLSLTVERFQPRVQVAGLLADGKFVGLMRSGFPLRLHYRLELWKVRSGWFDQFVREVSWDFLCRLEVTTLNDTDLQELERWLKGDVSPAVSGGGSFGDALVRGAQRVLVRIAGLPRLNLEARSAEFRPER